MAWGATVIVAKIRSAEIIINVLDEFDDFSTTTKVTLHEVLIQ